MSLTNLKRSARKYLSQLWHWKFSCWNNCSPCGSAHLCVAHSLQGCESMTILCWLRALTPPRRHKAALFAIQWLTYVAGWRIAGRLSSHPITRFIDELLSNAGVLWHKAMAHVTIKQITFNVVTHVCVYIYMFVLWQMTNCHRSKLNPEVCWEYAFGGGAFQVTIGVCIKKNNSHRLSYNVGYLYNSFQSRTYLVVWKRQACEKNILTNMFDIWVEIKRPHPISQ